MKKVELILVPAPGMGHLVSALEFAKRLVRHDHRISITILPVKFPFTSFVDAYIESIIESEPDRIEVVTLPRVEPPSLDHLQSPIPYMLDLIHRHKPLVKDIMSNISSSNQFPCLVFDFLCSTTSMVDVANEFNIPSYIYLPSNAGYLSLLFYLTARYSQTKTRLDYSDPDHLIPGIADAVPSNVLPSVLFDKYVFLSHIETAQKLKAVKGIIVNTFEELESCAISYFSNSLNTPPVYPVGPVLDISCQPHPDLDLAQHEKIMKWLDDQPQSSVVFLCFGSLGSFRAPQVKEMALGLEQSGHRFLWSLRVPPPSPHDDGATEIASCYKNPEDMLPEGFIKRIQGRGMICGWAPQVEILAHKAVGGFVSHCGWNSILESLWFGVPIVTWPLYAEQHLNAFRMVKELKIAVELRLDYKECTDEVVMAEEIAKAVHRVMDEGSEVRKKVKEMWGMARKATENGGSSFTSIGRLIDDMVANS